MADEAGKGTKFMRAYLQQWEKRLKAAKARRAKSVKRAKCRNAQASMGVEADQ